MLKLRENPVSAEMVQASASRGLRVKCSAAKDQAANDVFSWPKADLHITANASHTLPHCIVLSLTAEVLLEMAITVPEDGSRLGLWLAAAAEFTVCRILCPFSPLLPRHRDMKMN